MSSRLYSPLQQQENLTFLPCRLFIDKMYPFIEATPDGLIGKDTVVEIKCPLAASKKGLLALSSYGRFSKKMYI